MFKKSILITYGTNIHKLSRFVDQSVGNVLSSNSACLSATFSLLVQFSYVSNRPLYSEYQFSA